MALLRAHGFEAAVGARNFCSLEPAGAHLVRGVLAPSAVFRAEELSSAYGSRVAFSLRGQRESNPRERPPRLALAGLLPGKSVSRGRAFRTGILPVQKGIDIPVDSRCAACRPRLTAAQGTPGKAAGHPGPHSVESRKAKSESHSKVMLCCGFASVFDLALLKSARWERAALPGAPMARRVSEGEPAGWPAGWPASFSPAQDVLSTNPAVHPRTRGAGEGMDARVEATQGAVARCPQGAPSGWPSLWLLSLGHPRESDSASEGGRKLFAFSVAKASRTRCAPTARRRRERRRAAINAPPAAPAHEPRSPPSATARRGGCRSRLRNIPTSPSMLADSKARNLREPEDIAPPRRRRRPNG